jgi:hypothetical protein
MMTEKESLEANNIYNLKVQKLLILKREFIIGYLKGNCDDKLFAVNVLKVDLQIELLNIEMSIMQIGSNIHENKPKKKDQNVN